MLFSEPTDQYAVTGGSVTFSATGLGVAGVTYQWQSNGVNIVGTTSSTLTLTNVSASYNANYDIVVTSDGLSITSAVATFTLVVPPGVASVYPPAQGTTWINYGPMLSVTVTNVPPSTPGTSLTYNWMLNGTAISGQTSSSYFLSNNGNQPPGTNEGAFTVGITNAAGSTNVSWNLLLAVPGMTEAWGDNTYGECARPSTLTNVAAIAAGEYQSVALTDGGIVYQWGQYWNGATNFYWVTNSSVATLPPNTSNLVAVSASIDHVIALTTSNTVVTWGLTNSGANFVPTNLNLTNISAVGCGWAFNVALRTNGTVTAWGNNLFNQTNVPTGLTNVTAIAVGAEHGLALSNGFVIAWGYNGSGQTNVPSGLSNVVAIAAGDEHSMALKSNGMVVAWGSNTYGQTNVPAGLSNVMAIAAGGGHSVALLNNGTVVAWGDNSNGQTNTPNTLPTLVTNIQYNGDSPPATNVVSKPSPTVKLIAAGGNHTMASIFSPLVQYPIDVSKDLLLIYNATNISFSSNVCAYYLAHRPMVSNANVLAIVCTTNETISPTDYTNVIVAQVQSWLTNNPTKRPAYVILFQDIPSRVNTNTTAGQYDENYGAVFPSVQYQLNQWCMTNWHPFVTSINMNGTGGTNDCIAYINKLASISSNYFPGKFVINPSAGRYGNTNWYFDDTEIDYAQYTPGLSASNAVFDVGVSPQTITYVDLTDNGLSSHITNGSNLAGYACWGAHSTLGYGYAIDGDVNWFGNSSWYIMETFESYNGQRNVSLTYQGNFLFWFSSNAFGGTNYSNTPVGAVTSVDEPYIIGASNPSTYYALWATGKNFAICAWNSQETIVFQAVGDPFTQQ